MTCLVKYLLLAIASVLLFALASVGIQKLNITEGNPVEYASQPTQQRGSSDELSSIATKSLRSLQETTTIGNVMGLILINADSNLPIRVIRNNTIINIATINTTNITIEASTTTPTATSIIHNVVFEMNKTYASSRWTYASSEWLAPYAFCGDVEGRPSPCTNLFTNGTYTISATPYFNGVAGNRMTATFTIIDTPIIEKSCNIPRFTQNRWSDFSPLYPIRIKETQGLSIGSDIVIISGFTNILANATNQTYARDVIANNGNTTWRRMDDLPSEWGITHAAVARVGRKLYMCGGFYGGNPGLHISDCYVYDHDRKPGFGRQWSRISSLPYEGTGGGGMVYDSATNALYYAAGGTRNKTKPSRDIYDVNAFYKYELHNPNAGWTDMGSCPYLANHISAVTAYDRLGNEHHFFLGGQIGKDECQNNVDKVYEWNAMTMNWTQHTNIPFPRGHAPSSTLPIGCGFVMAGGSINSPTGCFYQTADISYYDIETRVWTSIGKLSNLVNAPVCSIGRDGYFYHISGVSNRRRIRVDG